MSGESMAGNRELRTRPQPACPSCGGPGVERYAALRDRLFGVPGTWTMRGCARTDCGLLWLDPAPLEADLTLAYADYYTHASANAQGGGALRRAWAGVKEGYLARRFGYAVKDRTIKSLASWILLPFPTRRESLDVLGLHLPALPGGRVLEVGCGAGDSLLALRALGWQVEGLELDPAAVRVARGRGLSVKEGDLAAQDYADRSFDALAMVHVLEHLPDPIAVLGEARRILRKGGRLVVITPNAESLAHRRFGRAWRGLEPPRHVQVFSRASLVRVVEAAGFGQVRVATSARMAAVIHAASRSLVAGATGADTRKPAGSADAWFQWAERMALLADPAAGEELVLTARPEAP